MRGVFNEPNCDSPARRAANGQADGEIPARMPKVVAKDEVIIRTETADPPASGAPRHK